MSIRFQLLFAGIVFAICGTAHGGVVVQVQNAIAELRVGSQTRQGGPLCDELRDLNTFGSTEVTCSIDYDDSTADSFASVSMTASADHSRFSIRIHSVGGTTGLVSGPYDQWPWADTRGYASLGIAAKEPMQISLTVIDIGTDAEPNSVSEMRVFLSMAELLGSVISRAGEITQTGVLGATIQAGGSAQVYVEFEDVSAFPGHPNAYADLELLLEIEPLTCGEVATGSTAGVEVIGWENPVGGSYSDPSNWDPQQVPTHECSGGDMAVFELQWGPEIFVDAANATAGAWRVFNNLYRFRGPAQLYSDSTADVSLEVSHGGWLNLSESTLTTVHSSIGPFTGATAGRVSVQNPGSVWDNYGRLGVSNGELRVSAGGKSYSEELLIGTVTGRSATVSVSGAQDGTPSSLQVDGELVVGQEGTGALDIRDGATVWANDLIVSLLGEGSVLVSRSSNPQDPMDFASYARLLADGPIHVGGDAPGTLRIENGGAVDGNLVLVSIGGSGGGRLVIDGQGGIAYLNAQSRFSVHGGNAVEVEAVNGGRIAAESIWIGGGTVPGTADVTIRGSSSQTEEQLQSSISTINFPSAPGSVGAVVVGKDGPGQLNLYSAARTNFRAGLVVGEGGSGLVIASGLGAPDGQSTSVAVIGPTEIGRGAPGTLQLGDGAIMQTSGDVIIGKSTSGTVNMGGAPILNINGTLTVGDGGMGSLSGLANSQVDCKTLIIGRNELGTMDLTSSAINVFGNAQVGTENALGSLLLMDSSATLTIDGTLTIGRGPGGTGVGLVSLTGSTIRGGGNIVVNRTGSLVGTGTIELCSVCTVNNGGTIAPGLSPGTLTIHGGFEQLPSGRLEIEYAGNNPGEFDVLHVTGPVTLGGRLEIHFRDGFSPAGPDDFVHAQDFVEADQGTSGDYEQRVYVYPDEFADFDDDGDKDLRDMAAFANCFAESGALSSECRRADWEHDGVIAGREVRELSLRLTGPR